MTTYEEAAEKRTDITGWVCKTCRRFWGEDEHMARWCCAKDLPCECGGRREKSWNWCKECCKRRAQEKWEKMPKVDWDGVAPLAIYEDDRFFWDADELRDYCYDLGIRPSELRLRLCDEQYGPSFDMADHLCDVLSEESDLPDGCDEINKVVNDWIESKGVLSWVASGTPVTPESVMTGVGWTEEDEKELTSNDQGAQ